MNRKLSGSAPWALSMVAMLLVASAAHAEPYEDISLSACKPDTVLTYAAKPSEAINTVIGATNATTANVFWELGADAGCSQVGGNQLVKCPVGPPVLATITAPAGNAAGEIPAASKATIVGTAPAAMGDIGRFTAAVAEAPSGDKRCQQTYLLHTTSNGGGWGDPHLTTVGGVHYDFQSAGEFTALREDELEIQTRQTAVPSATVPITNEYTGLKSCVAIYTAVAARFGKSRVTLQPNLKGTGGEADPSGMQLRVDGELVTLTDKGIDLYSGAGGAGVAGGGANRVFNGRIAKAAGNSIELIDSRGTQLVVTPAFWNGPNLWYLNVNVYQTSATLGTLGRIPEGSWLPSLPDDTSVGARPESASERYQVLYGKFADAWRVTDANSLFDYQAGTNTATFTLDEWPRDNPQSCGIQGQTSVQPATEAVAQQACAAVADPVQKADCVFDVTVTGNTGFGESYQVMGRIKPHGTGWQTAALPTAGEKPPMSPTPSHFNWWWLLLILLLLLIVWMVRRRATP